MTIRLAMRTSPAHIPVARTASILAVAALHLGFVILIIQQSSWFRPADKQAAIHYLQLLPLTPDTPHNKPAPSLAPQQATSGVTPRISRRQPVTPPPAVAMQSMNIPAPASSASPQEAALPGRAPALDLDSLKRSALAIDRQRQPGTIEQIQQSHRRDESLEKQLADGTRKAERKDCLKAYSGIGLLGLIPLAVSTVVDTGCKW